MDISTINLVIDNSFITLIVSIFCFTAYRSLTKYNEDQRRIEEIRQDAHRMCEHND